MWKLFERSLLVQSTTQTTPYIHWYSVDRSNTRKSEIALNTTKSHVLGISACITRTDLDDGAHPFQKYTLHGYINHLLIHTNWWLLHADLRLHYLRRARLLKSASKAHTPRQVTTDGHRSVCVPPSSQRLEVSTLYLTYYAALRYSGATQCIIFWGCTLAAIRWNFGYGPFSFISLQSHTWPHTEHGVLYPSDILNPILRTRTAAVSERPENRDCPDHSLH